MEEYEEDPEVEMLADSIRRLCLALETIAKLEPGSQAAELAREALRRESR